MKFWPFYLILIVAVFFETFTTLPLTLVTLLGISVILKEDIVFPLAFFAGIFLDVFLLKPIGLTSLFFVTFIFIVTLYERKFETASIYFVSVACFLFSFGFLLFFGYNKLLLQSIAGSLIGVLLFLTLNRLSSSKVKRNF